MKESNALLPLYTHTDESTANLYASRRIHCPLDASRILQGPARPLDASRTIQGPLDASRRIRALSTHPEQSGALSTHLEQSGALARSSCRADWTAAGKFKYQTTLCLGMKNTSGELTVQ